MTGRKRRGIGPGRRRRGRRDAAVLCALITVQAAAAYGQSAGPGARLSLPEAARRALSHHPSVEAAAMSESAARSATRQARAARLPSLAVSGSATRYEEPALVAPLHGFDPNRPPAFDDRVVQLSAVAGYTLFDGGARGARIAQASARAGAMEAESEGARASVLRDVVVAYLDVLTRHEVLQAHDRRMAALASELARARLLFEAGRAPELEVLRAQAELGRARSERVGAETRLRVATNVLARLVGDPEGSIGPERLMPVALADPTAPERTRALEVALAANPEVRRAREAVAGSEAAIRLARSRRWPEVRFLAGYTERGGFEESFAGEWSIGAAVSLPVFDGGAAGADTDRARAEAGAAGARSRLAELRVREAVDRAAAAVEEADARSAGLAATVRQFEEIVRVERLALDSGAGTQTDYLSAEANLLEARGGYAVARAAAIAARAGLAQATGELGIDWLTHTLEVGS